MMVSGSIFQHGKFKLNSGRESDYKIECDNLTKTSIITLSQLLTKLVGQFGTVVGVPKGGLLIAKHLQKYATPKKSRLVLIVDDVWTTGGSMMRYAKDIGVNPEKDYIKGHFKGAVLFSRGPLKEWCKAVLSFDQELFQV